VKKSLTSAALSDMLWPKVFYVAADGKITAVIVQRVREPKPSFVPGSPLPLFDSHTAPRCSTCLVFEYDVISDGKRSLVHGTATPNSSPPLTGAEMRG
jgi:hypothetical protein